MLISYQLQSNPPSIFSCIAYFILISKHQISRITPITTNQNIYDLKSLGRSEDFVDVEEIKLVDLVEPEEKIISSYSAYVNYQDTSASDRKDTPHPPASPP